jgi:hypothetical protein
LVPDEVEAEMVCGMLRANGIVCGYRHAYDAGQMLGATGHAVSQGPIQVVEEHQLADAQQLLPPDD